MKYIYAALLLHKLGKEVNEENVEKVVAATGEQADNSKIKSLVTSLKDVDIAKELENASLSVASSGSTDSGAEKGKEAEGKSDEKSEKKEEKKEKEEAAADGLGALFG